MKTLLKRAILPIVAMVAFASFATAQTIPTQVVESTGNAPSISLYKYGAGVYVNVSSSSIFDYVSYEYRSAGFGGSAYGSIRGGGLCEYSMPYNSVILPTTTNWVRIYKRGQYGVEWSITVAAVTNEIL